MNKISKIIELRNKGIGYKKIGKIIGISSLSVSKILIKNGYVDHVKVPIEKQLEIIELYNQNKNYKEIIKVLNVSKSTITNVILINDIKLRASCYHTGYENNLDHDYFEVIDTEEKAYWLGFLYADGYVNENTYQIELTLCEKDRTHLDKFCKSIKSTYKISKKIINGFVSYRTFAYSKKMTKDLVNKGCYQCKSLTLKFPTEEQVPNHLKKHFIRGYIDGDGCFSSNFVFCVCGTKEILDWIINDLRLNTDISKAGSFQMTGNAYQWYHNSKKDYIKIHNYYYNNSTIYLDRKYNILPS